MPAHERGGDAAAAKQMNKTYNQMVSVALRKLGNRASFRAICESIEEDVGEKLAWNLDRCVGLVCARMRAVSAALTRTLPPLPATPGCRCGRQWWSGS